MKVEFESLFTTHCADSDIEKTYPAIQMAVNGGKQTTMCELSAVEGLGKRDIRMHGFHLIGGIVNSMAYCTSVFELPNQDEILEIFQNS